MCLWPTVALTACTKCLHTWPRLLWSPRPRTFLQSLKPFVPSPSYPESFMLRAGSPAIVLGIWRHYLQRGLCTLQKQSEPEALLGGAVWGSSGVCRRQGDMAESSLSLHSKLSHTAWRTPRSQLPHKQLADVRTGWHLRFNLRTFLQSVHVLLRALRESKVTGSPPHTWAPHLQSQMDNLCVLEIITAQACTISGDFKCFHNIFESISCSGWGFFLLWHLRYSCWPHGRHTVSLIKLEL